MKVSNIDLTVFYVFFVKSFMSTLNVECLCYSLGSPPKPLTPIVSFFVLVIRDVLKFVFHTVQTCSHTRKNVIFKCRFFHERIYRYKGIVLGNIPKFADFFNHRLSERCDELGIIPKFADFISQLYAIRKVRRTLPNKPVLRTSHILELNTKALNNNNPYKPTYD